MSQITVRAKDPVIPPCCVECQTTGSGDFCMGSCAELEQYWDKEEA